MKLARFFLLGLGLFTLLFGFGYLLSPGALAEPAGFGVLTPGASTDIRATYGGFQIGMGSFLVWAAAARERYKAGLVLVALSIGAVFLCRLIGVALDGELSPFHLSGLAFESVLTAVTLFVLRRALREA